MAHEIPSDRLNDRQLRLWGIPLSVLLFLIIQMPLYFPGRWDLFWKYVMVSIFFTSLIWEIVRLLIFRIRQKYPGIAQTKQRIWYIFGGFTLVVIVVQLMATTVVAALDLKAPGWISFGRTWIINVITTLFFVVLIAGVYEAMYFFGQYKSALQKAEHLKKQQAQASLDALKNRVNPHFLFNSLTTLSALIGEDPLRAERFLDELSKVYRHLLRARRQPLMTLGEELDFAKLYSFLLKNRFGEGDFSIFFQKNDKLPTAEADKTLPALTFQNTLDYLLRTQNLPLKIEVKIGADQLQISCDHHPKILAFDASDNDWKYLETQGAQQYTQSGWLLIEIPFSQNPAATT
jgi:two-component system, LytTR family, sensor kinase